MVINMLAYASFNLHVLY